MKLIDYDKAMLHRWKQYYKNTYFVTTEQNMIFEVRNQIAKENPSFDQTKNSIYPFFALRRIGIPELLEDTNLVAGIQGLRFGIQETRVPFAKFKLTYQLDVYSSSKENFDELCIEIQENIMRFPYFILKSNDPVWGNITFTITKEGIEDNSDVESFDDSINLYRSSITYTIDAIIARKYKHLNVKKFEIDYENQIEPIPFIIDEIEPK